MELIRCICFRCISGDVSHLPLHICVAMTNDNGLENNVAISHIKWQRDVVYPEQKLIMKLSYYFVALGMWLSMVETMVTSAMSRCTPDTCKNKSYSSVWGTYHVLLTIKFFSLILFAIYPIHTTIHTTYSGNLLQNIRHSANRILKLAQGLVSAMVTTLLDLHAISQDPSLILKYG